MEHLNVDVNPGRKNAPNAPQSARRATKRPSADCAQTQEYPLARVGGCHTSSVFCMEGGGHLAKGQQHLDEGSDRFLYPSVPSHKANGGVATESVERGDVIKGCELFVQPQLVLLAA